MQASRPSLESIQSARARLAPLGMSAPLATLQATPAGMQVTLKLENLQPVGSFKVRPIGNAMLDRAGALARGVFTCSSGNSGIALAWMARRLGVPATVVVPAARTPQAKLERLRALGARVIEEPPARWWQVVETTRHEQIDAVYIDAVRDPAALAGSGTVALEILAQLPDLEAIFVPFGGGSLACGVASAVRALKADVRVIACELDSAHPFRAARAAGRVVGTESDPGFVSGVGFGSVLPEMWPLCSELIDGSLLVSLAEVAAAIRSMAEGNKVIAEGAGALPVAAALCGRHGFRRVCAVVSGGNLDRDMLGAILAGRIPS